MATREEIRAIADAVRGVAMMPTTLRRFSTVRQNLPKSGENSLYERLGRWCQGGALGWVFDQADDRLLDLHSAPVIGFDTTEFLELPEVRTPVMLYATTGHEELLGRVTEAFMVSGWGVTQLTLVVAAIGVCEWSAPRLISRIEGRPDEAPPPAAYFKRHAGLLAILLVLAWLGQR